MIKTLNRLILLIILVLVSFYVLIGIIISNNSYVFLNTIHFIFSISFCLIILILIFTLITTNCFIYENTKFKNLRFVNFIFMKYLYFLLIKIASLFGIEKDRIRRVYIKLNNNLILSRRYEIDLSDLLILLPHCIQNSECKIKVTNEITNCISCGKCKVGDIVKLSEKFKVKVFIATGGTLARKKIIELKPKAIIAIACERDLFSGINDINKIPVLGVLNERPNGPCFNTNVDITKIEDYINFFTNKYLAL